MEDLSKNNTTKSNKTKIKLALMIVWMVVCTAMFIYFLVQNITIIAAYTKEIADWKNPTKTELYDQQFINDVIDTCKYGIKYSSSCLTLAILLYSSFMILIIPKLIGSICLIRIEHREDVPPQ